MKILLVNPESKFLVNEKVFPSLGLLYLSAFLKSRGYPDISLIDMNDGNGIPDTVDADIVGVYSNTPQFPSALSVIKKIKSRNKSRNPLYVIGGPHVSGKPEDAYEDVDVVVCGEGEHALLDIVGRYESGLPRKRMVRMAYEKDLDSLPFPDRDIIDIRSYKYLIQDSLATTVVTSRGCPYGCKFCANNAWGKSLRMRSPENIFEEVSMLRDKYGYSAFMFFDDTMTVNKKRMVKICNLLKPLNIIYRCFIRSDTVDYDILKLMKDSGCVEVGIGVESGSQRMLDTISKGESVERQKEAIKECHKAGIRTKGFFIVGLPGESRESIKETEDFLEDANMEDIDVTLYTPYPGSYIYENRKEFDIQFKDDYGAAWYKGKPGAYHSLVSTSCFTPDELVKIRESLESRFKKGGLCQRK